MKSQAIATRPAADTSNYFQGAHFSGCTLNVGYPLQQSTQQKSNCYLHTSSCRKRPRILYSDEED